MTIDLKMLHLILFAVLFLSACGAGLTEGEPIDVTDNDDAASDDDDAASDDDDDSDPASDDDDVSGDDDDSMSGDDDDASDSSGGVCNAMLSISCGGTIAADTSASGSTNNIDGYACNTWDATGPEMAYSFAYPEGGIVSATLTDIETGQDLDLYVLEDLGSGCQSDSCVEYGDTEVSFDAAAGQTYYLVVDGFYGAAGSFVLDVACGQEIPGDDDDSVSGDDDDSVSGDDDDSVSGDDDDSVPTPAEVCDDGTDNDGDGAVDCGDTDCSNDPNCSGGVCNPAANLVEGSQANWSNDGNGSTNAISSYSCQPNWNESGPEFAFQYVASVDGQATVNLSELPDEVIEYVLGSLDDLDVFVLDGNGSCSPNNCVVGGDSTVSWNVTAGSSWYIVVDGYEGDISPFSLTLDVLPTTPSVETNCTDGVDDDADGATDCDDNDCNSDPACVVPPSCVVAESLTCGDIKVSANNASGSTNNVDSYSCTSWVETGSEYTFEFVSPAPHDVTISLSGMNGGDLDLFLVEDVGGVCDADNCLDYGNNDVTFAATPGQPYYIVVDGYMGAVSDFTIEAVCN
ncbi:MAG: hypothetical protein VX498_08700 [Myxococcota bacterium]|nr:hypothetical protein [Myxococcota bacterium]